MSNLTKAIRNRREISRNRRLVNTAIANATTPTLRDELIVMAQRYEG